MLGKKVIDSQGNLIGKVFDIEIDLIKGSANRIFIRSGLSHAFSANPEDVITVGDRIIIRHKKADISKMETFNLLGIKRELLCNW